MPLQELSIRVGPRERTFRAAPLIEYARRSSLVAADADPASGYLLVTASDGARAAVALAEVDPAVASTLIALAVEQNGEVLRSGVRLVVPRDGTRSLGGVVNIETHRVPKVASMPPAADGTIDVKGVLPRPGRYSLADRDGGTRVEAASDGATFEGASLHHLLADAGMFELTDGEALAGQVVVVTASDGRVAVLAASEVGPRFQREPAILVPRADAVSLVVPYDRTAARRLDGVAVVELREG